jgi:HicA toxin of bacterial toxin-antitoxin,
MDFGGQVGSHCVMTKKGERANLSIPQHKELSVGTLRALIRAAGITVDEFMELLSFPNNVHPEEGFVGGCELGSPRRGM